MEGRLKDANIVMLSRAAKRAYDKRGIVDAGSDEGLPNNRANWLSLYTQAVIFTQLVARNLLVEAVVVCEGVEEMVEVSVSIVLAVAYVLK
jgi:hypothetical protein